MLTHPSGLFRDIKFRYLGVLDPEIFTHGIHWPRLASAHHKQPETGSRIHKNFKKEHLKLLSKFDI